MTHPDCGDPEAIHVLQVGLTAANRPVGDPDWPHRKALLAMLATVPDEVLTEASLSRVSRGKLAELMAADEAVSICQAERDSLRSELAAAQKERDELLARVECGMTSEQYEKARKELWGQAKRLGRELDDERAKVAAMRLDIEDLQTRYAERAEPRGDAGPGGLRPDEVCAGIARRLADVLAGTHERRVQSAPSSPPDPDPDCAECSGSGQIVPGATCAPCGGSGKPDPKPTGAPARDAQLHGGTCWLIERGDTWLARDSWRRLGLIRWVTSATHALAFPTKAEAEMFAREYLPELEGKVEVTEHGFGAGEKGEPTEWTTEAIDPRPRCVNCGRKWAPPEGLDATVWPCNDGGCIRTDEIELTPPAIPDRSSRAVEGPSYECPLPWWVGGIDRHDRGVEIKSGKSLVGCAITRQDAEFIVARCNAPSPTGADVARVVEPFRKLHAVLVQRAKDWAATVAHCDADPGTARAYEIAASELKDALDLASQLANPSAARASSEGK